jgi:hypothetical protein
MCNYIVESGMKCKFSPYQDRCAKHPRSKFPEVCYHYEFPDWKPVLLNTLAVPMNQRIVCLCGSSLIRYNFGNHSNKPKHKAWLVSVCPTDDAPDLIID